MKKLFFAGLLCALSCICLPCAAGTLWNVYIPKETLTEREAADREIRSKPEGLKVTRQSVLPWDETGGRWSIFVELENETEEAVIIDDTWLIACNAQKQELARWNVPEMDGAFWKTCRVVHPGERVVLFAGTDEVRTQVFDPETGNVLAKSVSPAGLSAFAREIRRAKSLRIGLDTRTAPDAKGHLEKVEAAKAWIADGKLHVETTDAFDAEGFVSLSVIAADREGRMLDALQDSVMHNEGMLKEGRFCTEKTLAPYLTQDARKEVVFEITGFKNP